MSDIRLQIDGQEVVAAEGMTLLEAARRAGLQIPTLCHIEEMEPYGGCRVCTVEVEKRGWTKLVAACVYPVEPDIAVTTRSEKIDRIRKLIIELLAAHAPDALGLEELIAEYGADRDRFDKEASFCIHCALCVRFCGEVKGKHAVGFVDRGGKREISFIPKIAHEECRECQECFALCPTEALQAAYVLTESLGFHGQED
jgi:NADH dehydrogenase/NADH:ubiquinone oxidoreductase subunit G